MQSLRRIDILSFEKTGINRLVFLHPARHHIRDKCHLSYCVQTLLNLWLYNGMSNRHCSMSLQVPGNWKDYGSLRTKKPLFWPCMKEMLWKYSVLNLKMSIIRTALSRAIGHLPKQNSDKDQSWIVPTFPYLVNIRKTYTLQATKKPRMVANL